MIKAVFFDLYGTLAGFRPSRYEIQSTACSQFGITVTPKGVLKGYALADAYMAEQSAIQPLRERDQQARDQFFAEYERRVMEGAGVDVSTAQADEIWRRVRQLPYELERFDDALPTLEQLKERGLTLGLISNMNQDGASLAESMGLSTVLDFAVTSAEVGSAKPHPPIFLAALGRSGARPDEAVHVGDQVTSDIDGASNVGISPVLLDRDRNHPDITRCPRIETLSELPELLADF
jgi:putative hydrolase of the HAD superfamily